ncbi:lipase family protein [Gordonia malaquae]|uniref:lipase family protein n=1 Tax=Gordonia malaquae TaxID=410332 RepID=UPI003018541E
MKNESRGASAGARASIWRLLIVVAVACAVTALTPSAPASGGPADHTTRGTVISVEALEHGLVLTRASGGRVFEYTTTGADGRPATSLGSLYLPKGKAPAGGWPVLSYGHGTAGLSDDVVSYTGWAGDGNTGDAYLSRWLDAGFAVAATEYVGIGTPGVHPYLNTRSEGAAMIDVVRAARSLDHRLSNVWVANGYSQGGHATLAAAALATEYAPELVLAGASAGGVPAGVADELAMVRPDVAVNPAPDLTVYTAYVLAGFRAARPDHPMDSYLSGRGRNLLDSAERLGYHDMLAEVGRTAPAQMVRRPLAEGTLLDAVRRHLGVPTRGYSSPVQIYQQSLDVVSPAPFSALLAQQMRANGVRVTYRMYHSPQGHAGWDGPLTDVIAFARAAVARAE